MDYMPIRAHHEDAGAVLEMQAELDRTRQRLDNDVLGWAERARLQAHVAELKERIAAAQAKQRHGAPPLQNRQVGLSTNDRQEYMPCRPLEAHNVGSSQTKEIVWPQEQWERHALTTVALMEHKQPGLVAAAIAEQKRLRIIE